MFNRLFHQFTGIHTVSLHIAAAFFLVKINGHLFFITKKPSREKTGVHAGDLFMSFKSIFQDVRSAMDHVHLYGDLQNETVAVSTNHNNKYSISTSVVRTLSFFVCISNRP